MVYELPRFTKTLKKCTYVHLCRQFTVAGDAARQAHSNSQRSHSHSASGNAKPASTGTCHVTALSFAAVGANQKHGQWHTNFRLLL